MKKVLHCCALIFILLHGHISTFGQCEFFGGGYLVSNVPYACSTFTVTLNNPFFVGWSGSTTFILPTFQWQSSPDNITWSSIPGATADTYSFTGLTEDTYYRMMLYCSDTDSTATEDRLITYNSICPCTDTSIVGGIATADTDYCKGCYLTLNLSGVPVANNLSYDWEYSTDSITWAEIPPAPVNKVPYSFLPRRTAYYICQTTCNITGASSYSSVVHVNYADYDTVDAFLQGKWLEVGENNIGAFGSYYTAPAGFHPRDSCGCFFIDNSIASVYDYGHDGWTTGSPAYFGDYMLPGSVEGWELQINDTDRSQAFTYNYNLDLPTITGTPGHTLTGKLVSHTTSGGVDRCMWSGTAGNTSGLSINMETRLDTNASWVVINVKMRNTSSSPIPDIYYMRTCDPDNDGALTNSYFTDNKIEFQNDSSHRVMASATGQTYTNAYLGLGTKDSRAVAFIYDNYDYWPSFLNTDLSDAWSGTLIDTPTQYTQGDSLDGGYTLGLVFKIGTLAPGDSTTISYAYIYNGVNGIDSAFPLCLDNR